MQDHYIMYLRKSRADRDFSDEETLTRHRRRLDELCASLGITCNPVLQEVGSADSIAARPEMIKLLSLVESGQYAGVVCIDMDRLSRGSGSDQALVINTFKYSETKIITPSKTYDFSQDTDEQFAELGLFLAKQEYRQIKKRMMQGRIAAVKEGKYSAANPPYGYETYKLEGQKGYSLRVIPEQAETVKEIFRLRTEELLGSCAIATRLNQSGCRDQRGNMWTMGHVRKIMNDPTYTGKVRFQRRKKVTEMVNGQLIKIEKANHDPIICQGIHEPIISEEVFARSQEIRVKNQVPHYKRGGSITNPLAGILRCSVCGKAMLLRTGDHTGGKGLYCPTPGCPTRGAYLKYVEDSVVAGLGEWLHDYETTGDRPHEDFDKIIGQIVASEKKLADDAVKMRRRLVKAHEAYEDGIYSSDEFRERSGEIKAQIENAENAIKSMRTQHEQILKQKAAKEKYKPAVKDLISHYHDIEDPAEKNKLLKEIVEKIEYTKTTGGRKHGQEFDLLIFPRLPQ